MRYSALVVLMGMTASLAHGQQSTINWAPLTYTSAAGDSVAADSGRVTVLENRARPNGAKIEIAVVRFRSTAARPGAPIIYLAGGPGAAGIAGGRGDLYPTIQALRSVSDVILFDQRGTGFTLPSLVVRSTFGIPLTMSTASPEALTALVSRSKQAAAEVKARGIDLASYNTVENAHDLDDIRKALGANKVIIWGHSYGSHLGLAYIRFHEKSVERAMLGGINGLDQRRRYPADADILFRRIDSVVKATPRLRAVMPDFLATSRRAFARMEAQPGRAMVDSQEVVVSKEDAQAVIAVMSGEQSIVRRLPWIMARLEAGDYSWMARQVRDVIKNRPIGTTMTYVMDLASGVSAERSTRIRSQVATAILGNSINYPFDNPEFQSVWEVKDLGPQFRAPVRSSIPALFISGTLDGRTSLGDAEEVRRGFRNGAHVVVSGASHNPYAVTPELMRLMLRFASGGRVRDTTLIAPNVELRGPDEAQIIDELRAIALKDGGNAAATKLREYSRDGSGKYVSSFVVSGLFQALATQARDAAIAVLRAGLELFPANSFLLTRLAEAETVLGNKPAAIDAYRKAVAADPFNQGAAVQLRRLTKTE
ncbi:MAG TPA: alpha/beta fold hydrolase [Gemmatimonadaceae bacterium]|nr:alpha/beta fold hydrolase [Gemmatimonadaceae bacterium]